MLDLILKVIRAILASLYMLFEGMPALEALRSWFGEHSSGAALGGVLTLIAGAAVLSLLAFLLFMWWLSKRPPLLMGRDGRTPIPERREDR